jgi:hypothetical protein
MIVLKRRPLHKRIAYSYRAYRALGINRWHSLRMALATSIVRKVPPRRRLS